MARLAGFLAAVHGLLRTLIAAAAVTILGTVSWFGYQHFQAARLLDVRTQELSAVREELAARQAEVSAQAQEIVRLGDEVAQRQERIDRLETALRLLKVDHRVAQLSVLEQGVDPDTQRSYTRLMFVEVDDEGAPLDEPKVFRIDGDLVYVDYWLVKFDDKYVAEADLDRSTSICLFRRLFGEFQEPSDGFVLDRVGTRPRAYASGGQMSDFERRIWDDFWNIAHDRDRAQALGIRAAHGEAVSTRLRPATTYRLLLRASGGLSITPVDPPAKSAGGAAG